MLLYDLEIFLPFNGQVHFDSLRYELQMFAHHTQAFSLPVLLLHLLWQEFHKTKYIAILVNNNQYAKSIFTNSAERCTSPISIKFGTFF